MKRILSLLILFASICIAVSAQYILKIKFSDGYVFYIKVDEIDKVSFEEVNGSETINVNNKSFSIDKTTEVEFIDSEKERQALIDFYNALNGDHWVNNENWCSDKPLNEWYGVYTDWKTGLVNGLEITSNNLFGKIPESISDLTELVNLILYDNQISGPLPESLTTMYKLKFLGLGWNPLGTDFPKFITSMTNLTNINFCGCDLYSNIPSEISNLVNLKELDIADNLLDGTIPASIGLLTKLKVLSLGGNRLTGPLPEELGNLVDLEHFSISFNNFSNTEIPDKVAESPWFEKLWYVFFETEGFVFPSLKISAPNFSATTFDGKVITDELYSKNDYTILMQWYDNTTCWYMVDSVMPTLTTYYNECKDKGLGFVGYCVPETTNPEAFIKETGMEWPNFNLANNKNIFQLRISPAYYIVNNEGKIVSYTTETEAVLEFLKTKYGEKHSKRERYTSTDFSKDGEVITMQRATVGKGINLILMGEGFVDKDMDSDGKYEQTMQEALEIFFDFEPYKSLRNRFNVYMVKAVSQNDALYDVNSRAFLGEKDYKAFEYANKVQDLKPDEPRNVIVIYPYNFCRSYTTMFEKDGSFVAWVKNGMVGISERNIIVHEAGGHGFAKLGDEYIESGQELLRFTEYEDLDRPHSIGWFVNVDYHSTKEDVFWRHFLNDSRYDGEVGIYEGAFLYGYGAYRPTVNSMMRYNDSGFNAPSREAIYKAIMKASEGDAWVYDYEEFVAFDAINRHVSTRANYVEKLPEVDVEKWKQQHRPPVIVQGTWRDAVNKKTVEK